MHTKLDTNGTKFGSIKSTHKHTHEKLDGIDLKGYVSHLSNLVHSTRQKCVRDVRVQLSSINAFSDVVAVSKVPRFVQLPTLTYGAQ